jgi:site-specific DNA recombinase
LREQWPDLDVEPQQAIIKAILDHAVIAPGTPGSRSLDINCVQPHWRIQLFGIADVPWRVPSLCLL